MVYARFLWIISIVYFAGSMYAAEKDNKEWALVAIDQAALLGKSCCEYGSLFEQMIEVKVSLDQIRNAAQQYFDSYNEYIKNVTPLFKRLSGYEDPHIAKKYEACMQPILDTLEKQIDLLEKAEEYITPSEVTSFENNVVEQRISYNILPKKTFIKAKQRELVQYRKHANFVTLDEISLVGKVFSGQTLLKLTKKNHSDVMELATSFRRKNYAFITEDEKSKIRGYGKDLALHKTLKENFKKINFSSSEDLKALQLLEDTLKATENVLTSIEANMKPKITRKSLQGNCVND